MSAFWSRGTKHDERGAAISDAPATETSPSTGGDDTDSLPSSSTPVDAGLMRDNVIAALRTIYDPEIPVNIYDLGLIYALDIDGDGRVDLRMTLTTPGCPVAATFPQTVEQRLYEVPGIAEVRVELVWDPPWTMDRLSEETKLQLGLL